MAIKATPEQIVIIENDPQVLFVQQDRYLYTQGVPTGLDRIESDLNPLGIGDGIDNAFDIDIAIVDTGVDTNHPDLRIESCQNFTTEPSCEDLNGHGTHVSGTAAAIDNADDITGTAAGARIHAVKVCLPSGSCPISAIIAGLDFVASISAIIDVVNMSLGGQGFDDGNCGQDIGDAFHFAVCGVTQKGVVVVVAAGNNNQDARNAIPATYGEVITVSALADFDGIPGGIGSPTCRNDLDDNLAFFSNFGHVIDVIAPGVCITSTWNDGGSRTISGTSMASPHVAGVVGLYILENGKPTDQAGVDAVKSDIVRLGFPMDGPLGWDNDRDVFNEPLVNGQDTTALPPLPPPVGNPPVARDDNYSVDTGTTLVVPVEEGLLVNDTDIDGDTLTARLIENPNHGVINLNPDGSFDYTPDEGVPGVEIINYVANDGSNDSNIAQVIININFPGSVATISIDDVILVEGDLGVTVFRFTAARSHNNDAISFDLRTVDDTATEADRDYIGGSGTFNFLPGGVLSKTVPIAVIGDTKVESDEIFFIELSNCTSCIIFDGQGQGTILNDDGTTPPPDDLEARVTDLERRVGILEQLWIDIKNILNNLF